MTKEEVQIKQEERLPVRDFGRAALHNRHWLVFCVVMFLSILYMTTRGDETDHVRRKCDGRWLLSGHMVSGKEHGGTACVLRTDQFGLGGGIEYGLCHDSAADRFYRVEGWLHCWRQR